VGDIDVEHGRLDVDRHVRLWNASFLDQTRERASAGADPAAGLPAFLVADKRKHYGRIERQARAVKRADGFERGAKPGLEVARAAAPDAPVDQRAAERILALGARPSLPPALHLHGVGVTDQEQRVAAIPAAPPAPYIRPARLKIARPDVLSADRG